MGNTQDLKPKDWASAIDQTRARIDHNLETFRNELRGTFSDISSSAKEAISEVREKFTLRYQTEQHPWSMVGASVAAGAIVGSMVGRGRSAALKSDKIYANGFSPIINTNGDTPQFKSAFGKVTDEFGSELRQIRGLAIGALIGILRDLGKKSLPPTLAPRFSDVVDSATRKLGGTPL